MDIHEILQSVGEAMYTAARTIGAFLSAAFSMLMNWIYSKLSAITLPMMPTMMKIFSNAKINRGIFYVIALYIVVINITAFMMFGIDKKRAKKRGQRISEKALMRVCIWGGAIGGVVGMSIFKHKTKHKKFSISLPVLFVIQLVFDSFLLGFLGFWAFF